MPKPDQIIPVQCMYTHVCTCVYMCVGSRTKHKHTHTQGDYIHIHVYVRVYKRVFMCTILSACMYCMCLSICACACVSDSIYTRAVCACLLVCVLCLRG